VDPSHAVALFHVLEMIAQQMILDCATETMLWPNWVMACSFLDSAGAKFGKDH
jgi:hypothetical protein